MWWRLEIDAQLGQAFEEMDILHRKEKGDDFAL